MFWMNSAELILVLGAIGGCLGGVITVYCQQQRMSRCSSIKCCCGLIECVRDVEDQEEMAMEMDNLATVQQTPAKPEKSKKAEAIV